MFNDKLTRKFQICFLVFYQACEMFILSSISAVSFHPGKVGIISVDPTWGCLGFLDSQSFMQLLVVQGFLSGLWGGYGQNFCFFFHAPVVTQSSLLTSPFFSALIAKAFKIDKSLDFLSFLGAVLTQAGTLNILRGDRLRRNMFIQEQLLREEEN